MTRYERNGYVFRSSSWSVVVKSVFVWSGNSLRGYSVIPENSLRGYSVIPENTVDWNYFAPKNIGKNVRKP
mgnify:CR=1 FL=1